MHGLPSGTVTFLFTDIEGSTRRWEESPEQTAQAVERHDRVIRDVATSFGGSVFTTSGDGFSIAFGRAEEAVRAAVAAQVALLEDRAPGTPLRVRMAVNTGEAVERDGNYFGAALNETGRLLTAGHGGQVLMSGATREVLGSRSPAGVGFLDLGEHRLRDVARAVRIFQLTDSRLPGGFPALRTLEPVRGNLPMQATSFVGRDRELVELEKAVRGTRMVTVTGAGGAGKTRMAIEVASGLVDEFPDGVWFVDLASVSDPARVVAAVAGALGLPDPAGDDPLGMLAGRAGRMAALVVLDNCEHLLETVRPLVAALVRGSERLRVLATSRERLGVQGEVLWPLPPLGVPVSETPLAELRLFDAIRLFEERADAAAPGFRLTADNADAVGRICRCLDGIPLGVELAAARLTSLSVDDIAARLEGSLAVLGSAGVDVAPHHRTLHAAVEWSYRLLEPTEQALLGRLAVFSGGWTLDAAEQIGTAADNPTGASVVDAVSSLVDKSLVAVSDGATGRRYRLLEPIRQYASAALDASGERTATEERHAEYFSRFAEERFAESFGPSDLWLPRLEADIDNLRLALEWHLRTGEAGRGQLMAGALYRLWFYTGRRSEAKLWRDRFVAADSTPGRPLARALHSGIIVDQWRIDEAIELYRQFGPPAELAMALNNFATDLQYQGDWTTAVRCYRESQQIIEAAGRCSAYQKANLAWCKLNLEDDAEGVADLAAEALRDARAHGSPVVLQWALMLVGVTEAHRGNHHKATRALEEALEIETRSRMTHTGGALWLLAWQALLAGDLDVSLTHLRRLRAQARALPYGDPEMRLFPAAPCIFVRGEIDIARGDHRQGAVLLAAATALRESGHPGFDEWGSPFIRRQANTALEHARTALGDAAFEAAWAEGTALSFGEALDLAIPPTDD